MKNLRKLLLAAWMILAMLQVEAQDTDALFNQAKSLFFEHNYQEALSQYQAILESQKGDSAQLAEAYGYAGICNEELGKADDAIANYKKALEYKVPELTIYDKAIALTKKAKKYDLHEWALMEKGKYFPEFEADVEKGLVSHYLRTKKYDKLLVSSEKMTQWYPDSPKYHYYMGVACERTSKVDSAVKAYQVALEKDADYTSANMSLGYILFKKGSTVFEKHKKIYEAKAKPTRMDYTAYRKSLEEGKVIYKKAEGYLLKAYNKKPNANLKKMLYVMYTRMGEKENALKYK